MKVPKRLLPLIDDGIIDEVVRPLMSGKEAAVFVVRCGEHIRCAKVYKDAAKRSFKKAVEYQEGRKVRNSRRSRAMQKGTKFGRKEQETLWHSAEVDALYLLAKSDVRVPQPYGCFDGVLIMDLIVDQDGDVAPRLNDVSMSAEHANEDFLIMIRYIVRMLCAGVVHGDLSPFNVLVDEDGPIIIDLPQAVNPSANPHAQRMLARDVNTITDYYGIFAPEVLDTQYAKEIWALYEAGDLQPETPLTGEFTDPEELANVDSVMLEIKAALREEEDRLARLKEDEED